MYTGEFILLPIKLTVNLFSLKYVLMFPCDPVLVDPWLDIQTVKHLRSRNIYICCAMNKLEVLYYSSQNTGFNQSSFKEMMET